MFNHTASELLYRYNERRPIGSLLGAKNAINENELYDLVDECDWKSTRGSKVIVYPISNGIYQLKVNKTLARSSEAEFKTPELNSGNGTAINFDLISQAIKTSRKQKIQVSGNVKPNNTRRKSFFDKASNFIGYLNHANYEDQNNNKKERKVRFRNDVIKSQLRRFRKTKKDLFKLLDSIVQGYSEEEEKFRLLCHEIGVYNSSDPMVNVTGTANESFA